MLGVYSSSAEELQQSFRLVITVDSLCKHIMNSKTFFTSFTF